MVQSLLNGKAQKWRALLGILLVLLSCAAGSACRKRGAALLEQAQASWDNSDYQRAAQRYEEFLQENANDQQAAAARFKVGNIYLYNLKNYELAIQHYIHLIEDFPQSLDVLAARQRLAESYAAAKKPREAIMEYENLLLAAPVFAEKRRVRLNIADLYYDLNELGQSLAEYQKVIAGAGYDDLTERAQMRIGGIHLLREEYGEAIAAYQIVAQGTKDGGIRRLARYGLVDCYERTFKFNEAVGILVGTESDPNNPDYIQKRISSIRDLERQRNLSSSSTLPRRR
jgi:tetratricopeptide (TPR) repeat protein